MVGNLISKCSVLANMCATKGVHVSEIKADGDRYNLQYRTANDDKVRPEHAALHGVTLPPSDPFWAEFYPPNGWNCRCTVVQVRKSKYPATPHDEAMDRGADALQRDKKGMFRFNPGIEQKTVPDYNPYTISRCRNCDIAKGKTNLAAFIPEYQLCRGCQIIRQCYQEREKANKGSLPKLSPEQKHEIYSLSLSDQFKPTEMPNVLRHVLKAETAMDYKRVLRSAALYSSDGNVLILPEIHESERDVRQRLGIPTLKKNPDLKVPNHFVDIKSPFSCSNIGTNAVDASKQGAIACITDDLCIIDVNKLDYFAMRVLRNKDYNQPEVHFIVEGRLYKYNSHGRIHG